MSISTSEQAETPFELRRCYDCLYLKGYVSLWCTNPEAVAYRGTAIPGVHHCPFWETHYGRLSKEDRKRMEAHGFEKPSFLERMGQIIEATFWV